MSPKRTDREKAERRRRREEDVPPSLEELAADAAAERAGLQDGLECPACGCRMFDVVYTERVHKAIRRRRACRRCGWRVSTMERIPPEMLEKALPDRKTSTGRGQK